MAIKWHEGTLTKVQPVTKNTSLFFLKAEEFKNFDFKPGQFITLDLPIADKPSRRWRSFSIASAPDGNELELVIVHLKGGAGSTYLFKEAKIGEKIRFQGPKGIFTLPEKIDRDLFMICTGTGIAPYRSMLQDLKNRKYNSEHNIYLIFGTRTQKDLLYVDEMKNFEKNISNFYYIPTLSREKWAGETGYVHAIYERLSSKKQPAHFFVCGWREMVKEARQRIKAIGYDRKAIHQELYG
ncbi:MAG TPA: FAD-binding oxidoreductase [Chitinophagaceae bacterium]|nr:FAD-binding oxidoreductase [Chitinophagaceae bacterium]